MTLSPGQRHMVLATLLFTTMGVLVKHLQRIPAHEVVFFRAAVTLVITWAALRRAGISPWGNNRQLLLARGAAGTVALLIYFYTLQRMPLASAVTVQYLCPLFTLLLAGPFLGEAATPRQWGFFGLCFAGVAAIKGFDPRVALPELALGVLAAALAGVAYNLVRRLKGSDVPLVVVFYFPLVTFPVIGPYTVTHWVTPRGLEWLWLLAVGVLTQFAQVSLTKAYHMERAVDVSHLTYLGTLWALALGYLVFGETVPLPALGGIGLVVLGVVLATRAGGTGGERRPAL